MDLKASRGMFFSNHTRERIHRILNPGPLCLQLRLVVLFKFLMQAKRLQQTSKNRIEDDTVITAECLPCARYAAHVSACIIPCDHPRKPGVRAPCPHYTQEGMEAQQDSLPYTPHGLPRILFTVSLYQTQSSGSEPTEGPGLHRFCSSRYTQWVRGFSFLRTARNGQMSSLMI